MREARVDAAGAALASATARSLARVADYEAARARRLGGLAAAAVSEPASAAATTGIAAAAQLASLT